MKNLVYNPTMQKIADFFRVWGLSLLMMAVIFIFSSIPSNQMPDFGPVDFLVKKSGHALGYALLALTNLRALQRDQEGQNLRPYIFAWILAVLYAVTDEFHQSFVPGRDPTTRDAGIDALGAVVGLWFGVWLHSKER